MITFKTEFPLNPAKGIADLIEAGRIWLAKSPHYELAHEMDVATGIGDNWQRTSGSEKESILFMTHQTEQYDLCAFRFSLMDKNSVRWTTEAVGAKSSAGFPVSVQLNVDVAQPTAKMFAGERPYLLKVLLRDIGGGMDGSLPVSDKPHLLRHEQLEFAADIVKSAVGCTMPVVYVSRNNHDQTEVNPQILARELGGMAHIVVEPDRGFSFDLRGLCEGQNAYEGAVTIYWPDARQKSLILPYAYVGDQTAMQTAVIHKVRIALLSLRTSESCTWNYVDHLRWQRKMEELKASGSRELDDYITLYDEEMNQKNREIQSLREEHDRLQTRLFEQFSNPTESNEIVLKGEERDLYNGERMALIIEALAEAQKKAFEPSRRHTLLKDLIGSNPCETEREVILKALGKVLKKYKAMDNRTKSELGRLGFVVESSGGTHHKLVFRKEQRFTHFVPSSGGDHRGGMNNFSDLKKKLF